MKCDVSAVEWIGRPKITWLHDVAGQQLSLAALSDLGAGDVLFSARCFEMSAHDREVAQSAWSDSEWSELC